MEITISPLDRGLFRKGALASIPHRTNNLFPQSLLNRLDLLTPLATPFSLRIWKLTLCFIKSQILETLKEQSVET